VKTRSTGGDAWLTNQKKRVEQEGNEVGGCLELKRRDLACRIAATNEDNHIDSGVPVSPPFPRPNQLVCSGPKLVAASRRLVWNKGLCHIDIDVIQN
jgi:hypothetical protein